MFLKSLNLTNFRNFSEVIVEFSPTTLLIGNNAQGKSNLLESIYYLATTKSPRAEKDIQLIQEGKEFVRVVGAINGLNQEPKIKEEEILTTLEITLQKKDGDRVEKRLKVNGVPRRGVDYIGNLVVVYFSPEDIQLVSGPPSLRRLFLDGALSQVNHSYKNALSSYYQTLTSRNRLLKQIQEGRAKVDELSFWTEQMIQSAQILTGKRGEFLNYINRVLSQEITKKFGELELLYQPNILSRERVNLYLEKEIGAGLTLIGPQRDDFLFQFKGNNLAFFGSRGEQRISVLKIKLAELQYINEAEDSLPVLLLDDIFSELDQEHRLEVVSVTSKQQTIFSAVEESQIPKELLKGTQILKVEKGDIKS